jgi:hypothetical protein
MDMFCILASTLKRGTRADYTGLPVIRCTTITDFLFAGAMRICVLRCDLTFKIKELSAASLLTRRMLHIE